MRLPKGLTGRAGMIQLAMMAAEMLLVGRAAKQMGKRVIQPYLGRALMMLGGLMVAAVSLVVALALGFGALFGWLLGMGEPLTALLAGVAVMLLAVSGAGVAVMAQARKLVEAYDEAVNEPAGAPVLETLQEVEAEVETWVGDVKNAFTRGWERA